MEGRAARDKYTSLGEYPNKLVMGRATSILCGCSGFNKALATYII